ncbi:MAG: NnrU family protein [Pseudomonadota bacterium]
MIFLIAGLVLFIGLHSTRIFANDWRNDVVGRIGLNKYKMFYSVISLIGFVLLIYGFGQTRADPSFIWTPPLWSRHLAALLTLFAFILFAAAEIPGNHIKSKLGHPMYLGVKLWAFAHLMANGRLGDILLFGVFLMWAIVGFSAARRRDRREGVVYPSPSGQKTAIAIMGGIVAWALFAFWLHRLLIGVPPL